METATAAIAEEKREPVQKQVEQKQLLVTGQWLYDQFVQADTTQVTRLNMIRDLVTKGCDPFQLKGACDKMVEKAREVDLANGVPAKIINEKGKEVQNRGPKQQYAMNVRTALQQAFGALKFATDEATKLGYTERTGYNDMGPIAKKALAAKGIDWRGEALPTEADREKKAFQREKKAESQVMAKAVFENPRLPGESETEWVARVAESAREATEIAREKAEQAAVSGLVDSLFEKNSPDRLHTIACRIFDRLSSLHGGTVFSYSTDNSDSEPMADAPIAAETEEPAHAE